VRHIARGNYVWWLVPAAVALSLLAPSAPPQALQTSAAPVDLFANAVTIKHPRELRAKVRTIGSMPVVLGLPEHK
jgi:hypothetical protein